MKLLSGIASKAQTLGMLAGAFNAFGGQGIDYIASSIQQLIAGTIHAPDLQYLQGWAGHEAKDALMIYIGGIVLDALPIKMANQLAAPLQKGAIGYAIATGAVNLLYGMTHSEIKGVNILNKTGAANAPTVQQAQMMYY